MADIVVKDISWNSHLADTRRELAKSYNALFAGASPAEVGEMVKALENKLIELRTGKRA